jgi:hypothetical protein
MTKRRQRPLFAWRLMARALLRAGLISAEMLATLDAGPTEVEECSAEDRRLLEEAHQRWMEARDRMRAMLAAADGKRRA